MPCLNFRCAKGHESFFCTVTECPFDDPEDGCLRMCEACGNYNATLEICRLTQEFGELINRVLTEVLA
jgi:hypothetical protein